MRTRATRSFVAGLVASAAVGVAALGLAASARAEDPAGEPVKWDQARVTQYSVELNQAIEEAVHQLRKSPLQTQPGQRQAWYDMREDLRLLENTSDHLQKQLQAGAGADETRATFDRIESLRHQAEEHGRKLATEEPVMAGLVNAGAIHNQMRPYYFGKR